MLVSCPTRSPSSRKNRNLVKGLRRRRRAQLPAHHIQGSSNIVLSILQATDQIAAYVRNRVFSDGIPSKEIQTREAFSFQGGQICCLPMLGPNFFLLRRIFSLSCRTYRSMSPMKTLLRGAPPQQIILGNFPNTQLCAGPFLPFSCFNMGLRHV